MSRTLRVLPTGNNERQWNSMFSSAADDKASPIRFGKAPKTGKSGQTVAGMVKPRTTAGRARKALSTRFTLGKSSMPTNSPAS